MNQTPQLPNLSYIGHLQKVEKWHLEAKDFLTDAGFPCVISNELVPINFDDDDLIRTFEMVRSILTNPRNLYFTVFLGETKPNPYLTELGLALSNPLTQICLIGNIIEDYKWMLKLKNIKHFPDFDTFIYKQLKS